MEQNLVSNITIEAMENDNDLVKKPKVNKSTFDAKNYLNTKLDIKKGETSKVLKIRLLPIDSKSSTPFKRIKMHNVEVPHDVSENGFKSYVCLSQVEDIDHDKYGYKCPFCEANKLAYEESANETDPEKKSALTKKSLSYKSNDVGIIRCIERGNEEDGPKFWKFNIRKDEKDPLNVIKKLYNERLNESREEGFGEDLNILDIYKGKDLKVTITAILDSNTGKPTNKSSISIIDYGQVKPLSDNPELVAKWVNDSKVWSDVFVPKSYEYLKILLDHKTPWFDSKTQTWVPKVDMTKKNVEPEEIENGGMPNGVSVKPISMVNENQNFSALPNGTVTFASDNRDLPF